MAVQSVTIDRKAGLVTIVLDYDKNEPMSGGGKLLTLAKSEGGFEPVRVDGKLLKVSAFVGRKPE